MKYKSLKLNFRLIAKTEPLNLEPSICQSKTSPFCKYPHLFLKTRKSQVDCFFCLKHNNMLDAFPLEDAVLPKGPKKRKPRVVIQEDSFLSDPEVEVLSVLDFYLTGP